MPPFFSTRVSLKSEDSPAHFKQPALYLKQLRERGDCRLCDVGLLTDLGNEYVHSAVAAAHCRNIARFMQTRNPPFRFDVRGFKPDLVMSVVHWMYSGDINVLMKDMVEMMSITNNLGASVLHHLFENALRTMVKESNSRIDVLNIATHPRTGVSSETITFIVRSMCDEHETISRQEITRLQPWAIRALVAASVKTSKKVALINSALQWLRQPENIRYVDIIVSNIAIDDMNIREVEAFQRTLRTLLLNPTTRELVSVVIDNAGIITINMDKSRSDRQVNVRRATADGVDLTESANVADDRSPFKSLTQQEEPVNNSFVRSPNDLPSYEISSPSRRIRFDEPPSEKGRVNIRDRESSTKTGNSPEATEKFPTNRARRLHYTKSEIDELHNYPAVTFTRRDLEGKEGLTRTAQSPQTTERFLSNRDRRRLYTRSEIEELHNYPANTFNKCASVRCPHCLFEIDLTNTGRSEQNLQEEQHRQRCGAPAGRDSDGTQTPPGPAAKDDRQSGFIPSHYVESSFRS
ncbi:hypothetical protein Q1695_007822 [Nippostrongylus brasiliensis]|nr:hypothetical protein Q1695_007822 [Nippostrongylus brasiliensis]